MRVVYGARCTWWDTIDKVGEKPFSPDNPFPAPEGARGLPCCPHCQGVLFETESEDSWWEMARTFEGDGHSGYAKFLEWSRGKCYPDMATARRAYAEHKPDTPSSANYTHVTHLPEDQYFDWRIHYSGPQKPPYGGRVIHLTGGEMEKVVELYNGMTAERLDTGESEYEGE